MSDVRACFEEFFPHRVCINLQRRPERWARMQARFAQIGMGPVERFPAVDGANVHVPKTWPESAGAYGCLQSHLALVRQARAQGRERILIMEDDVLFAEQFHEEFAERVRGLPEDWDMLFFGCLHFYPPEPVASGIGRLRGSFSTFMYAVRNTIYNAFIFLNKRERYSVDRNNLFLQSRFRCYCFMPHLAWVDDSYSDAQGLPSTHWYIRDSMALGGETMRSVEKRTAAIILYREAGDRERGVRNLRYLARCYGSLFSVLILEQNVQPCLKREMLPPGCEIVHVPRADRNIACATALDWFAREKDFFIINDGNVVCSRMEMRASLAKCAEYDAVGSFAHYLDLDEVDSDQLIGGRRFHTERYPLRARRGRFCEYFTARQDGLRMLCSSALPVGEGITEDSNGLHIFDSPGSAICLSRGQQA